MRKRKKQVSPKTNDSFRKEKVVRKEEKFDSAKFYIEYGIDVEKRRIMLDEDIDEYSIGWVVRGIHKMLDASKTDPIDIFVNSYGGSVYDCLALIDTISSCEYCKVRTHAIGKVMSAGLLIFISGDEKYARPNATLMAHTISSETWGKEFEMNTEVNEVARLRKVLFKILAENSTKTEAFWTKELKYEDKYYDYAKAKAIGFITHDYNKDEETKEE